MKILANENFPGHTVSELKKKGHDIVWVRTEAPGISDVEVLERARNEGRVVITFDKDFGELAFRSKIPIAAGIILFRISMASPEYVTRLAIEALESKIEWAGHFTVIEDHRIRTTPIPK